MLFFTQILGERCLSDTHMSLSRGTITSMIRTHTINLHEAALIAVSALDDMVTDLVRASPSRLSSKFLDWIADEATPLVEQQVNAAFANPAFASTLRKGDARIALSQWVNHWVCPHIALCFAPVAAYLPAHATAPAELKPLHDFALPASIAKPLRPVRVAWHPVAAAIRAAF